MTSSSESELIALARIFDTLDQMGYRVIRRQSQGSMVAYDKPQAGVNPSPAFFDTSQASMTARHLTQALESAGIDVEIFFQVMAGL
jgi:hypothetical protein